MPHRASRPFLNRACRGILPSLLLVLAACAGPQESADTPINAPDDSPINAPGGAAGAPSLVNESIGVAVASIPEGFALETNEGDTLRFVRSDGTPGTLAVVASPPQTAGVNLVQATRDHKEEILAKPQGRYNGSLELLGPLGTAFQSRGGYQAEDGSGMLEDFRIYALHPSGDRLLVLHYLYPAGTDMAERQGHLFDILGELGPPPPPSGANP